MLKEELNIGHFPCFVFRTLSPNLLPILQHEEFGSYVSSSLTQIKDELLIKRTKCQIQLILTKALAEHAEKELASTEAHQQVVIFDENGRVMNVQPEDLIVRDDSDANNNEV